MSRLCFEGQKILGIMLYDMDFEGNAQKPDAMFYRARMKQGVIVVPSKDSEEVLR